MIEIPFKIPKFHEILEKGHKTYPIPSDMSLTSH